MKRKQNPGLLLTWLKTAKTDNGQEAGKLSLTTSEPEGHCVEKEGHPCDQKSEENFFQLSNDNNIPSHRTSEQEQQVYNHLVSDSPYQSLTDLPPPQQLSCKKLCFQPKWYKLYSWLHYVPSKNGVFCHTCITALNLRLLAPNSNAKNAFTSDGFRNWKKATERFDFHARSQQHKESLLKLTAIQPKNQNQSIVNILNNATIEERRRNRIFLEAICSTIKFIGKQGLAFRNESKGNFTELLKLRSNEIPELKQCLHQPRNLTSPEIVNEICEIMANKLLRNISLEAKSAEIFSLIVDETTDISTKEQLSLSIRYVHDDSLKTEERFLGLYQMDSTTGEAVTLAILDVLRRLNLNVHNLRGQCYDGGSNMKGKLKGVQARILEMEPRALYVHCLNHSLNLALQDSVKEVPLVRDTFQYVNDISVLIGRSAKRQGIFENIAKELEEGKVVSLKALCPTRWSVRVSALTSLLHNYHSVTMTLAMLGHLNEPCSPTANGLLHHMENFGFLFVILMSIKFFRPCEVLATLLQQKNVTMAGSIETANAVLLQLEAFEKNSEFYALWIDCQDKAKNWDLSPPSMPRKKKVPAKYQCFTNQEEIFNTPEEYYNHLYTKTLRILVDDIKCRFDQENVHVICQLEASLCQDKYSFSVDDKVLLNKFGINVEDFCCQIKLLRQLKPNVNSLESAVISFLELKPETKLALKEIHKLIKLLLVLPSSTATAERSFSMLRRVKTYLRSTLSQQRLNHLCIMNVYQEELEELNLNEIMEEFIRRKDHRLSKFGLL